jgi:hypothetical protein
MSENYKNYFLGLLSAEDAETLELRIISSDLASDEIVEELHQSENNLIEDFIDGNLTSDEIQAFNANYLITDERRERVEFVRLMRSYADNKPAETENKPSFFEQLKAYVSMRPLTFAAMSLALILFLGIGWQILFRSNTNVADAEIVALNKQDLSNLEAYKDLKTLSLASGTVRSGGDSKGLLEKDLTEKVLVRLLLPNKSDSVQNFTVKISRNQKVIQTFSQRTFDQDVRLLLPKSLLNKGEYQISLEKEGEKYNYNFIVQ